MAIYAIHCAPLPGEREGVAESMRATRMGFCYFGFVFGPFWLAARRLWLPLLVYIACAALIGFLVAFGIVAAPAVLALEILAALLIGLEGRNWVAAALARRGLPLVDIIEAHDEDEAARVYFTRTLAVAPPSSSAARSTPPRSGQDVIGLFPEAPR